MIDERHLSGLLDELAESYEPPPEGRAAILAAARRAESDRGRPAALLRPVSRRGWVLAAAAVVAVVMVGAAIVNGGGGVQQDAEIQAFADQSATSVPSGDEDLSGALRSARAPSDDGGGGGGGEVAGDTAGTAGFGAAQLAGPTGGVAAQAGDGAKIVKTASVDIELDEGAFEASVARLTSLATGVGGFVAQSSTSEDEGGTRGQVTIRVPEAGFEQVMTDVRRLGTVRNASVGGQDVTAEFTDLEARLRTLQATRDQLLTLLNRATTIPDILGVQDRLNQVQLEIEQAQGRINQLDDQTSFATLTVVLFEEGAEGPVGPEENGLSGAWQDAKDGFTDGVEALVAGSGTGLFLLLVLAVALVVGRVVWRLTRRRLV